ncbi:hypothetical protein [Frigidibacter oleivorans]|uniref:hypothetical protein n=1 Tax=Frigidibacter oleivorans TaxID=2487129 RepID=UPI000F8D0C1B|nr:hypothetical protein [Frigidibacter oleivorans]
MRKQYHTRTVGGERHTWDVHRLVRLSRGVPVEWIAIESLAEIDTLWWYQGEDRFPTPRSIAVHLRLVAEADLKWPILICGEGRLMDGMHRVLKALVEDRCKIAAIRLNPTPEPDFVNVDLQALPYPDEEV